MVVDYTLPILFWLCSVVLPGVDDTWVMNGPKGPPMAITQVDAGFQLQPPKGVKAPPLSVSVRGTHVKLGGGQEIDVAKHLPVKAPAALADLQEIVCSKKRTKTCFETFSVGKGTAEFVFVNSHGKTTPFKLERVGD